MNILLICSAGMSTSLMVQKMRDVAAEEGLEATIWAVAEVEASEEVKKADVVLLGPQIRFKLPQMKELCKDTPIDAIDMRAYGMMDGKAVLHRALEMVK
ncbi:PTS sugar transporter subunit IIB [Amedibacillus sp. YH-ame10]